MHFAAKLKVPVYAMTASTADFDVVGCDAAQAPCLQRSAANAECAFPGTGLKVWAMGSTTTSQPLSSSKVTLPSLRWISRI